MIGTNLDSVVDFGPGLSFIDCFKFSRAWLWENLWEPIESVKYDNQGWLKSVTPPKENVIASTIFFTDLYNYPIQGRYVVLYEGEGKLDYSYGNNKIKPMSKSGRDVVDIDTTSGGNFLLRIRESSQKDYIRNIQVIPIEQESEAYKFYSEEFNPNTAKIFNPNFLEAIEPYKVLRLMNWQVTNGSNQVLWSDRPLLTDARWTIKGVPVEVMVALANQTQKDPWFNMPHMADDEYVRKFAEYVKNNLNPERTVYLEYSNECWNTIFPQTSWLQEKADKQERHIDHVYADRAIQIFKIWEEVFGSTDKLIRTICTQAGNSWRGTNILEYLASSNNLDKIDAIGIAPYFGNYLGDARYADQLEKANLDQLFKELEVGGIFKMPDGSSLAPKGALQTTFDDMKAYSQIASQYGVKLLAYEGGQHLAGYGGQENNQKILDLFIAANRDPRMGKLYQQYLDTWKKLGGGLFVHYRDLGTYTKWGSFGAMQNLNDINNPKYQALIDAADNPVTLPQPPLVSKPKEIIEKIENLLNDLKKSLKV